jgi:NAD-dependent DNA ligase
MSYNFEKIEENPKKYIEKISEKELVKLLKILSDNYYNTGENYVSDKTYDILRDKLEEINPKNKFLKSVGANVKGSNKVTLPFPMDSLNKIKEDEQKTLDNWIEKYKGSYVVSDKLDGVSAQLYKNENGKIFLYTRGNGEVGSDISHLIEYIKKDINENIDNNTSIRGELIITKKNFDKIKNTMSNTRSAIIGLCGSKHIDKNVAKLINFVAYSILNPKYNKKQQMIQLKKWKFNMVEYKIFDKINLNILMEYSVLRKKESEYDIDGLVCIDNSTIYEPVSDRPKYGFAFKIIGDIKETIIKQVIWNISKDGYLIPKIEIEPVTICGTIVKNATAFNAKYIIDNKIGKGSKIKIIKSGEIIPYILEVLSLSETGNPDLPKIEYKWNDSKVNLIAKNLNNNKIKEKLILHFFDKINVKFIKKGIIEKLVANGYDNIIKILNAKKEDLIEIGGIGIKLIDKIYNEIDNSFENIKLEEFMAASNIGRGLGLRKTKKIVKMYPNIMSCSWSVDEMTEKIKNIKGFDDITAKLFSNNFEKFKKFFIEVSKIKNLTKFITNDNNNNSDNDSDNDSNNNNSNNNSNNDDEVKYLEDKKIVFTGFRDKVLEEKIEKLGGSVSTGVSKNTYLIVCKDINETNEKITKGKKLNIKMINKVDFENLIEKYL